MGGSVDDGSGEMTQPAETQEKDESVVHTFEVGDWAVHPSHGVGRVTAIEEKSFGEAVSLVYVMNIVGSELKVMVPMTAAQVVGLRPVMQAHDAEELFAVLATQEAAVATQTWNRRFRAYTEMLASGSPTEIAKVLRDMNRLKFDKDLSFGERRLLDQARNLLVEEMALALDQTAEAITARVDGIFSN